MFYHKYIKQDQANIATVVATHVLYTSCVCKLLCVYFILSSHDIVEDSKDQIFPEGELDYSALSAHPPANKDCVLAVLAVIGDTVKTREIAFLAMAGKWQGTFAKAKMVDNEEDTAIKASPTNLFW